MNHLKIIDTILESSIKLIANKNSFKEKNEKIEAVRTGIKGVLDAEGKKLVMMNVDKESLEDVKKAMPGLTGPTVSQVLSSSDIVAVHAVVDEHEVFNTVNKLKKSRCTGYIGCSNRKNNLKPFLILNKFKINQFSYKKLFKLISNSR